MIINQRDINNAILYPTKNDAPLLIDPNAVESFRVTL